MLRALKFCSGNREGMKLVSDKTEMGKLSIVASAGVTFRVLDSDGREQASGADKLMLPVPTGLYSVEWKSAGERSETLLRVSPGRGIATAEYVADPSSISAAILPAAADAPRIVKHFQWHDRPSERSYGSSVAIVVSNSDGLNPKDALGPIRLLNQQATAMHAFEGKVPRVELSSGEAAHCYHVRPGSYLLSFSAVTGETLQQAIPALPNRQTVIFLDARRSEVLVGEGGGFVRETRIGIDPSRTVMISVSGEEGDFQIRERIRLTRVLLRDLSVGSTTLTSNFEEVLRSKTTDPLLKMNAAVLVIARIEAGKSPLIDHTGSSDGELSPTVRDTWLGFSESWLSALPSRYLPSDVAAARWQIARLKGRNHDDNVARNISMPTMLACSWRWVIARSVVDDDAIALSSANLAAARTASNCEPWLCWKEAAAKALPSQIGPEGDGDLEALVRLVAEKASAFVTSDHVTSKFADAFESLSPEVRSVAAKLSRITKSEEDLSGLYSAAESLAASINMPGKALLRRLLRTEKEIDSIIERGDVNMNESGQADDAYALARRITVPDDPQKDRFGKEASRAGFVASAHFAPTRSKDWTRITITVTGNATDGDEVQFYLHDSFHPPVERSVFSKGVAAQEVTAWGGFTVGVWLPAQRVELELDLALLPSAPQYIRTR
jgi:hypothetical protein